MKPSTYQQKRIEGQREKAITLYKQGFSSRQVSKTLKEMGIVMSHTTVARVVKEIETA